MLASSFSSAPFFSQVTSFPSLLSNSDRICAQLYLGITVDPISGLALTIDALSAEDTKTLQDWIEPIAKSVGATVLVTDDADGFKTVADSVGVQHQVCKAHVLRNTEALIERYQPLVARDADGSLQAIGVSRSRRRQPT